MGAVPGMEWPVALEPSPRPPSVVPIVSCQRSSISLLEPLGQVPSSAPSRPTGRPCRRGAGAAFCVSCLEGGFRSFPRLAFLFNLLGFFFFFFFFFSKQTRRLKKKSCQPRRRHAFSNPPVWERSQLDEQREGPHVWDQRGQVNAPGWLGPGERAGPQQSPPSPPPRSQSEPWGAGAGGRAPA